MFNQLGDRCAVLCADINVHIYRCACLRHLTLKTDSAQEYPGNVTLGRSHESPEPTLGNPEVSPILGARKWNAATSLCFEREICDEALHPSLIRLTLSLGICSQEVTGKGVESLERIESEAARGGFIDAGHSGSSATFEVVGQFLESVTVEILWLQPAKLTGEFL